MAKYMLIYAINETIIDSLVKRQFGRISHERLGYFIRASLHRSRRKTHTALAWDILFCPKILVGNERK